MGTPLEPLGVEQDMAYGAGDILELASLPLGMVQEELCLLGHPRIWQAELIFLRWCCLAFPDAAGECSSDFQD